MYQPTKGIALILSSLFGMFGADKFYVGATGLGIVQLLLTLSIFGTVFSVPWAIISSMVLIIAILTNENPIFYPDVKWASASETDRTIMWIIVVLFIVGWLGRIIYKEHFKTKADKKIHRK